MIVEFSGWLKVADKSTFQYIGIDDAVPAVITLCEYAALSPEQRGNYIVENLVTMMAEADDLEWSEIEIVEEDPDLDT